MSKSDQSSMSKDDQYYYAKYGEAIHVTGLLVPEFLIKFPLRPFADQSSDLYRTETTGSGSKRTSQIIIKLAPWIPMHAKLVTTLLNGEIISCRVVPSLNYFEFMQHIALRNMFRIIGSEIMTEADVFGAVYRGETMTIYHRGMKFSFTKHQSPWFSLKKVVKRRGGAVTPMSPTTPMTM